MHLISFVSFKGGAGKTSALMGLTSCLANRGFKIGLLEADENFPLTACRGIAYGIFAIEFGCFMDSLGGSFFERNCHALLRNRF